MDDTLEGHALRRYWKGHYFRSLPDEALDAFLLRGTADGHGERLPGASLQAYGGAIAEVPDADSAFSQRDAAFEFVASARWSDAAEDEERMAAARRYAATLEPFASGMYVNAMSDEGAGGVAPRLPAGEARPPPRAQGPHSTPATSSISTRTSRPPDRPPTARDAAGARPRDPARR